MKSIYRREKGIPFLIWMMRLLQKTLSINSLAPRDSSHPQRMKSSILMNSLWYS